MSLKNKVHALVAENIGISVNKLDFSQLEFEINLEDIGGYYSDKQIDVDISGYVTNTEDNTNHFIYISGMYSKLYNDIIDTLNTEIRN